MIRVEFSDNRHAMNFEGDAYEFTVNTNGTLVITSNDVIVAHFVEGAWSCVINAPSKFFTRPVRTDPVNVAMKWKEQ